MRTFLAITAALEFATGLALVAIPSVVSTLLFGAQLDSLVALTVARVGGVALLAIGTACWLARVDGGSRAARGVACAMVIYNAGTVAILAYAGLVLRLSGIGLWPVVLAHAGMTAWCVASLRSRRPLIA